MNDLTIYDRFDHPGQFIEQLGKAICLSGMFGCDNASQGQVLALECASRKCPPMSLAERYHIIFGRLSMKADAMLADFRTNCGGSHRVVSRTAEKAAIELSANGETQTFTLTWDEARQEAFVYVGKEQAVIDKLAKGKTDSLMLKAKYATPRARMQMLWARVVSDGVRTMAPEVVAGYYTPEEVGDFVAVDLPPVDEVVEAEVVPVEPEPPTPEPPTPEPPATEPAKPKGVKMGGSPLVINGADDPYIVLDASPCGDEMAEEIKGAAVKLELPASKIKEIVTRCGVAKLADMPYHDAAKLLEKLRQRISDNDIPF